MSPHYRKALTILVFVLALSFAFHFAFSSSTLAQDAGGCGTISIGGGQTISSCHLECRNGTCTEIGNTSSSDTNKDGCTTVSQKCGPFKDVTGGAGGSSSSDLPGIDLTIQGVFDIIYGFACWLWSVAMVLLIIFIIWAGLRFMYAGADQKKYTDAKTNFKYVILGAIVVMGTFVIISTVAYNIGVDISFIPFDCSGVSTDEEPTHYSCNAADGACVVDPDADGGYTNADCDNACDSAGGETRTPTPLSCLGQCQQDAEDVCSALPSSQFNQCFDEEMVLCEQKCNGSKGYCGDGTCDANSGETVTSCPSDCGGNSTSPSSLVCPSGQQLAQKYRELYPRGNAPELDTLISCIKSKLPGKDLGSVLTYENTNDFCNYTRGNKEINSACQPQSCSYVINSCHYGGRTGSTGARSVNFGNEAIGNQIIQAANQCGAKPGSRCETSNNQTVVCPSSGNSANIHVHVNTATCDAN